MVPARFMQNRTRPRMPLSPRPRRRRRRQFHITADLFHLFLRRSPSTFRSSKSWSCWGRGAWARSTRRASGGLDRLVALKILPTNVAGVPGFAERFTREARALARLNHPHIVTLHDFGEAGGLYYFLMEYVDGVNLRQLTGGRPARAEQGAGHRASGLRGAPISRTRKASCTATSSPKTSCSTARAA